MSRSSATAVAHPNVALIKYWGKRGDTRLNLPAVDSLSITLGALQTRTTVTFDSSFSQDRLLLDGQQQPAEHSRLSLCLDALREIAGERRFAQVESANDFPTAAGLASSASGYAALAVAGAAALGLAPSDPRLATVARIGSGSAPRSLHGGFAHLSYADGETVCTQVLGADAWPLGVAIAVTSESAKPITSRNGMTTSRDTSPYYSAWVESHPDDMREGLDSIGSRDFHKLAEVSEHSCLKMHAVMQSTRPPLIYWTAGTLACIQAIRSMRANGLPVFFTIDAGPQVKAICLPDVLEDVAARLEQVAGVQRVITGGLGGAPVVLAEHD